VRAKKSEKKRGLPLPYSKEKKKGEKKGEKRRYQNNKTGSGRSFSMHKRAGKRQRQKNRGDRAKRGGENYWPANAGEVLPTQCGRND